MNYGHTLLAILLTVSAATTAQIVPTSDGAATTGDAVGLPVNGTLHFDLRYGQTTQFGNSPDGQQQSIVSGDASYANIRKRLPFSMHYGGGYGWAWAGPPSAGNVFQHMALSQGYVKRSWNLTASENVSYTFETPTTGFSGVPGTGEPIGGSSSTTLPDQTILAQNTRTLDNNTTLEFGHKLSNSTSFNTVGTWGQLRFIDGNGQKMNSKMANAGVTSRLNAHNSVSVQYSYTHFVYGGNGSTTQTNNGQFGFIRQWSRKLTTTVAAGPTQVTSSEILDTGTSSVSDLTMLFLTASANYRLRHESAGLSYSHGTTGGSGYMLGAKEDGVNGNYSQQFGRNTTAGITGSYMRSAALTTAEFTFACTINGITYICLAPLNFTPVTQAKYGGVQVTRKLGRYFNVFANYTAVDQSSNLEITVPNTPLNYNIHVLNGLNQVISFGIGYSAREIHLKY
jgi:hypothetical protein